MTEAVLDASALLALLLGEPGGEKVKTVLDGALLCAVNLAEVVSHYAKLGASRTDIEAMLRQVPIRIVPVDTALSYEAGMLRPITLQGGLSLGDRYCLALCQAAGCQGFNCRAPVAGHCRRRWRRG